MKNPCLEAMLDELAKVGIRDITRSNGGKHLQLRWVGPNGATRMATVPVSPSDWRSPHNSRAQIRRVLEEDGLLVRAHERKEVPPPKPVDRVTLLERRIVVLEQRLAVLEQMKRNGA
jgi:hypothetical protein